MKQFIRTTTQLGLRLFLLAVLLAGLLGAGGGTPAYAATPRAVTAWGGNQFGQSTVPAGLSDVIAIDATYHNLALKGDGTVVAWGNNFNGQTDIPAGLTGVIAIAAGEHYSLALKGNGTVVAWGALGLPLDYGMTTIPAGLTGVTAISAGDIHSLALKGDGTVVAWGDNSAGQINVPAGLTGVIAIDAGNAHNLALKSDGTVVAWGTNQFGQSAVPAGLTDVIAIAAGTYHSLALKSDGTVVAWGDSTFGQGAVPAGLTGVTAISAGDEHSLTLGFQPCPAGQYDNGSGCVAASQGYYVPVAGATSQTPCALGTYQPNAGSVSCIQAEAGHYVDVTAAVMQIDCLPGSYQPNSGATSCLLADAGFYVPEPAMIEQLLCQRGFNSPAGATECISAFFNFSGFLQPVDNLPALNQVKAGQGIPVKFSLGGNQGLNILASGSPSSVKIVCDGSAAIDAIEQTVTAGSSSLTYDATTDTYTYVWKTEKSWANSCRQLTVTLTDGTVHEAQFKFSK